MASWDNKEQDTGGRYFRQTLDWCGNCEMFLFSRYALPNVKMCQAQPRQSLTAAAEKVGRVVWPFVVLSICRYSS